METQNINFPNFTKIQMLAINEFNKLLNDKNLQFVKDVDNFIYYVSNNEKLKTLEIAKDFITISCDSKTKTALLNVYEYSNDLNYSEIANIFLEF